MVSRKMLGMQRRQVPSAGTPRWVKVFVVIAVILVLLLVIGLITGQGGSGGHGPGRHAGAGVHAAGEQRG
jgi:hypothetical protein